MSKINIAFILKSQVFLFLFSSPLHFILSIFPNEHMGIIFLYMKHTHTQHRHIFLCHIGDIFSVITHFPSIIIHPWFFLSLLMATWITSYHRFGNYNISRLKRPGLHYIGDHRKTLQPFKFNKSACCIYFCYGKQVLHYGHYSRWMIHC